LSELAKQMKAHGVANPWSLTEFDQWVNDATRTDIATIAEKHNYEVFGLKLWREWKKIRGRDLVGALNFSVDLIFKNEDEAKVDKLIGEYDEQTKKEWSTEKYAVALAHISDATKKLVDQLFELALMSCSWV